METAVTNNQCQELKNIKYKSMLLTGTPLHETKSSNDLSNLDNGDLKFENDFRSVYAALLQEKLNFDATKIGLTHSPLKEIF